MAGRTVHGGSALYMNAAIGVSLLCLFATLFQAELARAPGALSLVRRLSLTRENDFGAWWSGMLLLLASVQAADGYLRHRLERPGVARGWGALAVILAGLSLDEVGSLHERIGLHLGGWPALLPAALVLGGLAAITLVDFWRSADHRAHVWWIVAAFACFGLVAVQEALEHRTRWWGAFGGVRAALEEGSELLGMLILLRVTLPNARAHWPLGEVFQAARTPLLISGLAAAPLLGWLSASLTDHQRGNPAAWLAAAGFLGAAIATIRPVPDAPAARHWRRLASSAVCLLLSVSAVAFNPTLSPGASAKILLAGTLAVCVLGIAHASPSRRAAHGFSAVLVLLLSSLVWLGPSLAVVYAAEATVAVLLLHASSGLEEQVAPAQPALAPSEDFARMGR